MNSDSGAARMSLIVLLLLTLATLTSSVTALSLAWRLRRRHPTKPVLTLLAGGLAASGTLLLLLLGSFFVALLEPWPFSLHQGPDTDFSRSCLTEILRSPPSGGITDIYCRHEWGFGGDDIISIRFAYDSRETVDAIVKRLELQPISTPDRQRVRHLVGPGWWPDGAALERAREIYRKGASDLLWIHPETHHAYFQRANF